MTYFAKVVDGVVTNVIAADQDFIDNLLEDTPSRWIETFKDSSKRKNYAGIGFTYDMGKDAFIPPQPFASWTLDEDTCQWEAPVAYPSDGKFYSWNEEKKSWDLVE
tara:strand:- start:125 stop:442 length:318 start_codon:yes stop_codon:yes gene_type:complete